MNEKIAKTSLDQRKAKRKETHKNQNEEQNLRCYSPRQFQCYSPVSDSNSDSGITSKASIKPPSKFFLKSESVIPQLACSGVR